MFDRGVASCILVSMLATSVKAESLELLLLSLNSACNVFKNRLRSFLSSATIEPPPLLSKISPLLFLGWTENFFSSSSTYLPTC